MYIGLTNKELSLFNFTIKDAGIISYFLVCLYAVALYVQHSRTELQCIIQQILEAAVIGGTVFLHCVSYDHNSYNYSLLNLIKVCNYQNCAIMELITCTLVYRSKGYSTVTNLVCDYVQLNPHKVLVQYLWAGYIYMYSLASQISLSTYVYTQSFLTQYHTTNKSGCGK